LETPAEIEEFQDACRHLGRELGKRGHGLTVGSSRLTTADPHVVEGFADANSCCRRQYLTVVRPSPSVVDSDGGPSRPYTASNVPGVKIKNIDPEGNHRVAHLRSIILADVVVGIGGSPRGTGTVLYSAEVLRKPVAVLPAFGGASGSAWTDFKRYYSDVEKDAFSSDINGDCGIWASAVIDQLEALTKRNPFHEARWTQVLWVVLLFVAGAAAWGYCFATANTESSVSIGVTIGGMALSASIVGTSLRRALLAGGFPWSGVLNAHPAYEWVIGTGIALALIIISVLAGQNIANRSVDITDVDTVRRIGSTVSAIMFGSALFVEDVWSRLKERGRSELIG
jgi:hypothetical protein